MARKPKQEPLFARSFTQEYRYEIFDVLSRAGKTFVQTLTAQLTVASLLGGDYQATKAALVAALAAGIAVVWNAAILWSSR